MPYLVHHRRRHSWPYCGGTTPRERSTLPVLTATEPSNARESPFLASYLAAEDDAASAGIIRSKTTWSHRFWPHSSRPTAVPEQQYSTTAAGSSSGSSLRRMIRPPLDKARSLFVLPTTTTAGDNVFVSYWVPHRPELGAAAGGHPDRGRSLGDGLGRLAADRNHRRCHSEQPRAWRRPSAALWTLKEE
ncbi:hypothetical protein P170DRAFT_52123 [Aspergillus steynii IBT 23096]|uniref:Uncharacterized protein n=1 Tax=Aspergillus steynii IBT 23096 TaxID=1392250 RepID=A0A2I2GSM5_9EURO|nr:uncharacterized protein P170DRAFT_52123 [Aspergillus steynii IBT 23096]PLB55884.1 hypothetical protein P170DRAFT_52123 [Aspergillus steynii IBT 23096]